LKSDGYPSLFFFRNCILASMLEGKKILIGLTGSIAAYKIPLLIRQLVKAGAEVKVVMTSAATEFVSPLTLSTLSRHPVLSELSDQGTWANHVLLGRWADIMVIAPLSCNTLGKMANGLCDNLLLAVYLSATCPVVVAPAMDEDMWLHPSTVNNLRQLNSFGNHVLPVGTGDLASGLTGPGRMAEPEEILVYLQAFFDQKKPLTGKKALVTAGPTYEAIDPVRFIGNHSSGKMGFALAEELAERGADVVLISGPVSLKEIHHGITRVNVESAAEMFEACKKVEGYDIAVMSAAVADYTPVERAAQKIKKKDNELQVAFKKTTDILGSLGQMKKEGQLLVGFALETQHEEEYARKKLEAKNADLIVLNSLNDPGAGFGHDTNQVTIFYKDGRSRKLGLQSKTALAKDIVDAITELL
jgi:phosphopantothenoylcysteine decarboxylase/phosphopantothenate--cysteine ligase